MHILNVAPKASFHPFTQKMPDFGYGVKVASVHPPLKLAVVLVFEGRVLIPVDGKLRAGKA